MKNKTKIFKLSLLLIFSLLIFSNTSMACFNPTDSFATEFALNKPSTTYDLSGIKQSKDVTIIEKEKEESPDVVEEVHREEVVPKPIEIITIEEKEEKPKRTEPSFEDYIETSAIIYRSHYNNDIAVALMEEEWEGQKYLDVKIQVPTKFVKSSYPEIKTENREDVDLASAIDIDLDSFDWGLALRTELEWLRNNIVISGLTDDDLDGIAKVADKGTAGLLPEEVPRGVPAPYESVSDNQLPFGVTIAYHEKALIVGVITIIAVIVGIVGFVSKKRRR